MIRLEAFRSISFTRMSIYIGIIIVVSTTHIIMCILVDGSDLMKMDKIVVVENWLHTQTRQWLNGRDFVIKSEKVYYMYMLD